MYNFSEGWHVQFDGPTLYIKSGEGLHIHGISTTCD